MSRPIRRILLPMTMALGLAALVAGTATAVTPTPLDADLVSNAGAESGAAGTGMQIVPIPGWTTTGGVTAVAYGSPGGPAQAVGLKMVACGPGPADPRAAAPPPGGP